jgi:LytS/YehU family sensor histidine kinase
VQPAVAARPLAPMLLLPLATNAVRHGIEPAGGGEIVVRASDELGRLCIEVADSGAGRASDIRDGVGLGALRERLAVLYGERASLVFADREPCGITACIEIDDGVRVSHRAAAPKPARAAARLAGDAR